jgi:hypothetical protein
MFPVYELAIEEEANNSDCAKDTNHITGTSVWKGGSWHGTLW